MLTRKPFKWKCTIQRSDGQTFVKEYTNHWSPEKVEPSEVANACAAELTVAAGFDQAHMPKLKHIGITAELVKE